MSSRRLPRVATVAGAVAAGLWIWVPATAGGSPADAAEASYKPIQSISYQFGSKSTSGYFAQQDGACFIVLMISENSEPGALPPLSPTRARLILYPGETAGLDSEEGHSLNFTCGEAAATLLVTAGDRDRLVALQRAEHVQTAVGPQ